MIAIADRESISCPTTTTFAHILVYLETVDAFTVSYQAGFWDTPTIRIITEPTMADLTQKLPAELLAEILGHVPVLDVLRFKQVNRVFRDAILASPFIRHKIDLFAAGLEYNAAAGIGLAESQKAFLQYRLNLDSLRPIEERTVDNLGPDTGKPRARGGVYAIVKESVRLFSLGSASWRIPYKEWEIPLPGIHPRSYDFYPGADVIAFLEAPGASDLPIRIHLRTLSDGGYHPAAQCPAIHYL
ncbi:hypothetical protein BDM02DRAFT_3265533 [Thelephora ganbajun]|uniref:Uncharacterized protein n=1 Tax=Thelephora ganbajun TaxID=370292 RepID=A0ACB6ZTV0_THEGA|nr:hypothetical protein BDM02DRAFT_3265533 [Thelephora ganbajun]